MLFLRDDKQNKTKETKANIFIFKMAGAYRLSDSDFTIFNNMK